MQSHPEVVGPEFQHVNRGGDTIHCTTKAQSCLVVGMSNVKSRFFGSEIPSNYQ